MTNRQRKKRSMPWEDLAHLEILSWGALLSFARHYYGAILFRDKRETVYMELDGEEARQRNREDRTPGLYRKGSLTSRFTSETFLKEMAQKTY
ncbi:MAG: hypothetical protein ACETWD_01200, partial [Desulfatiglandales bacterium]